MTKLKIGDRVKVIKTNIEPQKEFIGTESTIKSIEYTVYFLDIDTIYGFYEDELELITPKSKKVKIYKYSREEILEDIKNASDKCETTEDALSALDYLSNKLGDLLILAKQPKQEYKKDGDCKNCKGKGCIQCSAQYSLLNDIETIEEIESIPPITSFATDEEFYWLKGVEENTNLLIKNQRILIEIIKSLLIK